MPLGQQGDALGLGGLQLLHVAGERRGQSQSGGARVVAESVAGPQHHQRDEARGHQRQHQFERSLAGPRGLSTDLTFSAAHQRFAYQEQRQDGEHENARVFGSERHSHRQTRERQAPERGGLHVAVERVDRGE